MVFRLSDHGTAFSTRSLGAKLLDELVEGAHGADHVEVDFRDVRLVSYSFADEFVGALMERSNAQDLPFSTRLANVGADPARVIERSLANRRLDDNVLSQA